MAFPHVIRLRGPWRYDVIVRAGTAVEMAREAEPPTTGQMTLPDDWGDVLGNGFRGRVRFTRRFGRPSGLEPHERVWLVIGGADASGMATLNDRPLGRVPGYCLSGHFDVTELLEDRNELAVDVELPPDEHHPLRPGRENLPGGLMGEVRLEVRARRWIERLWLEAIGPAGAARLLVCGIVAGEPTRETLAIRVTSEHAEVIYQDVQVGKPFCCEEPIPNVAPWPPKGQRPSSSPVSITLIEAARGIWSTARQVACRAIDWDAERGRLLVAGQPIDLPVKPTTCRPGRSTAELAESVRAREPRAVLATDRILDQRDYTLLDKMGVRVLQAVPPDWAAEVCPALSSHPSIVAWVARESDIATAAASVPSPDDGRPWIAREQAFAGE